MNRKVLLSTNKLRRLFTVGWGGLATGIALLLSTTSRAQAAPCDDLGGSIVGTECQITSNVARTGTFNLPQTLHLLAGGVITTTGLTLNVIGDFIMDTGSAINGNVGGTATGATVTVNATENILLHGTGASGAIISSNSSCSSSNGKGGAIRLTADAAPSNLSGDVTIEAGAKVTANGSKCSAGSIDIFAVNITNDGLVESASGLSGTGAFQSPGGGPISLNATCDLTTNGKVSSRGLDPGADLVHLEGGCRVRIFGLVESTGPGHAIPNSPPNHCDNNAGLGGGLRPDKPSNSTACVEVWAGDSLVIDSVPPRSGEVNADTAQSGDIGGFGWIDLFVRGELIIAGDPNTTPYAVHANQFLGNSRGGLITIKSTIAQGGSAAGSTVTMSGLAVQANSFGAGGKGGEVTIEATNNVALGTSSTEARGSSSGGAPAGGKIAVRSFQTQITGTAPGELDAFGGNPANGTVSLTACTTNPSATYTGVVIGARTNNVACGGTPTLPGYVILKQCLCVGAKITVTKECACSSANGQAPFTVAISGQVCNTGADTLTNVTLSDNPAATFTSPSLPVATLAPGACFNYLGTLNALVPAPGTSTDTITVTATPASGGSVTDTDDASCLCDVDPPGECPQDRKAKLTSTVDPQGPHGNLPNFLTVQEAVDAENDKGVIGLFGTTIENVVIDDAKKLTITQCTVAKIFAADDTLPVVTVSSPKKILIIGPDTFGGSIGWEVKTNGHELRGVRAALASGAGINVSGNSNKVSWNSLRDSGVGILVSGDANKLRGGTIENNVGNGAELTSTANSNSLEGATIRNNGGDGVVVDGAINTIKSNKATSNVRNEFDIGPGNKDGGSNKANNVKCKFDSNGKICN